VGEKALAKSPICCSARGSTSEWSSRRRPPSSGSCTPARRPWRRRAVARRAEPMRHRAKGRQLSGPLHIEGHAEQHGDQPVSVRRHQHHHRQGQGAAAVRGASITLARRGDLHARRLAARKIKDRDVLGRLFTEIGPRSPAVRVATSGSSSWDTASVTPRRPPGSSCSPSDDAGVLTGNTKGTLEGPFFSVRRCVERSLGRSPRDDSSRDFSDFVGADAAVQTRTGAERHRPGCEPSGGSDTSGASHDCSRG
jgi:hypothetical protein